MATTQTVRTHKKRTPKAAAKVKAKSAKGSRKKQASASTSTPSRPSPAHSTFTGTRLFDRSLHKTNILLKELMDNMNWKNRDKALSAFRATLHSLRDVLPLQEIPQLASQLPVLVRGLFYENWKLMQQPLKIKSVNEFYELVRTNLGRGALNFNSEELKKFTRESLQLISKRVSTGEMKDVRNALKKNLKGLFEEPKRKSRGSKHVKSTPSHVH